MWGRYRKDERLECRALISAGHWAEAHGLLVSSVGPALFLAGGRQAELSELVEGLAQGCSGQALHHAIPASDWFAGGELFRNFLAYSQKQGQGSEGAEAQSTLLQQLKAAGLSSATSAAVNASSRRLLLRQQVALSQMAQALHGGVMGRPLPGIAAGSTLGVDRMGAMGGLLSLGGLPPEPRMAGVATASADISRILV